MMQKVPMPFLVNRRLTCSDSFVAFLRCYRNSASPQKQLFAVKPPGTVSDFILLFLNLVSQRKPCAVILLNGKREIIYEIMRNFNLKISDWGNKHIMLFGHLLYEMHLLKRLHNFFFQRKVYTEKRFRTSIYSDNNYFETWISIATYRRLKPQEF